MKHSIAIHFLGLIFLIVVSSCVSVKEAVQNTNRNNTLEEYEQQSKLEILNEIEVYFKIVELGFREGRMLNSEEMQYANILKIRDAEGIRVLEYDRIPLFLKRDIDYVTNELGLDINSFDGYCRAFPRTIMVKKNIPEKLTAIIHELVHVKQMQDLGFIKSEALGKFEYDMYGYEDSPSEIEAVEKAYELQK